MGRGLYGQLSVEDWLADASRIPLKGISLKNIDYVMDIDKASIELGRTATLNYFLLTRLNIGNCRNMMKSAVAQRSFCRKVIVDLNRYEVDEKYDKAFKRFITALFNRSNFIYRIVQENLKLTRYWLYFETIGFDSLMEFERQYRDDNWTVFDRLIPEMDSWMKEHEADIDEYMEKIRPEIERRENFLAKKKADRKAENEARRKAKKAERDEIKMLKEQQRKNDIAKRRWEKEFETTMRRLDGRKN